MLRIYAVALEVCSQLKPWLQAVEAKDPDLARQARRALTSVVLNIAEGSHSRGRNRAARYQSACGSMEESRACVDASIALGYVERVDAALLGKMNIVAATLVRNFR